MAIKPIPRKRRRDKDMRKTRVIALIAASLYPLAKMALLFLAMVIITVIVRLVTGDFSGFWRTVGTEALFSLLMWVLFCVAAFIPTIIKSSKKKDYPTDDEERVDKIDRNISRKRIRKQKTLAKEAAKRKQAKK